MRKIIALVLLSLTVGCQGVVPSGAYIQADRATKKAVEPMLQVTAEDHPELRESIEDLVTSWEMRLQKAEQALGTAAR